MKLTDTDRVNDFLESVDSIDNISDIEYINSLNDEYNFKCSWRGENINARIVIGTRVDKERFNSIPYALSMLNGTDFKNKPSLIFTTTNPSDNIHYPCYIVTQDGETSALNKDNWDSKTYYRFIENSGELLGKLNSQEINYTGEICAIDNSLSTYEDSEKWSNVYKEILERLFNQRSHAFKDMEDWIVPKIHDENICCDNISFLHLDWWWGNHRIRHDGSIKHINNWWRSTGGDALLNLASAEYMLIRDHNHPSYISEDELITRFREGYSKNCKFDWSYQLENNWRLYQLYGYFRSLRAFRYWYDFENKDERENKAEEIKNGIYKILEGDFENIKNTQVIR